MATVEVEVDLVVGLEVVLAIATAAAEDGAERPIMAMVPARPTRATIRGAAVVEEMAMGRLPMATGALPLPVSAQCLLITQCTDLIGTAQSSNNDWGNPAPTRTADRNEDRNTHDDRRERYDERSNANSDTRSREGSVQVDGQAKARVAAAIGMNPERMRMAGMTPEQLSLARPRGGDDRSDRYERERDNVTPRPDERGRAASRYNDSQGGRYEQEVRSLQLRRTRLVARRRELIMQSQKSARESFDSRMARRQPSPVRRREPTPPSRAATPPADTGEFGGW